MTVASLIEGTGLQPKTEPRPVVKQMTLQPPATRPVIDTGSWPGVSINTKPRGVIGSPYWNTSIVVVVPPLVTPPSDFSKTVVMPPALFPGAGLLSIASIVAGLDVAAHLDAHGSVLQHGAMLAPPGSR